MSDTATSPARPARGRPPMSERRRQQQRLAISREAVRLFRHQGVAETSGEQIAEGVGLSARTLWRYFRTKESCVEPLLSLTTGAFVETLRRWPPDRPLSAHLADEFHLPDEAEPGDSEASLAVVSMTRTEPALRAIWLVVYERAEPVLAEVVGERLGRPASDLAVRVQAAALAAALRLFAEDYAEAAIDGGGTDDVDTTARLGVAVRAATHGVLGMLDASVDARD